MNVVFAGSDLVLRINVVVFVGTDFGFTFGQVDSRVTRVSLIENVSRLSG